MARDKRRVQTRWDMHGLHERAGMCCMHSSSVAASALIPCHNCSASAAPIPSARLRCNTTTVSTYRACSTHHARLPCRAVLSCASAISVAVFAYQ